MNTDATTKPADTVTDPQPKKKNSGGRPKKDALIKNIIIKHLQEKNDPNGTISEEEILQITGKKPIAIYMWWRNYNLPKRRKGDPNEPKIGRKKNPNGGFLFYLLPSETPDVSADTETSNVSKPTDKDVNNTNAEEDSSDSLIKLEEFDSVPSELTEENFDYEDDEDIV